MYQAMPFVSAQELHQYLKLTDRAFCALWAKWLKIVGNRVKSTLNIKPKS
jgi:hypothetical protein